ncbi:MAG: DUF1475 family protein [Chloroflexota bacterium]
MKYAKALAVVCTASMASAVAYGFARGDFWKEGGQIIRMPWGVVALVDAYVGFSLFSGWVAFREKSLGRSVAWITAIMTLGNVVSGFYAAMALWSSGGDWRRFWFGRRAETE